jgi:hypothetical protein
MTGNAVRIAPLAVEKFTEEQARFVNALRAYRRCP